MTMTKHAIDRIIERYYDKKQLSHIDIENIEIMFSGNYKFIKKQAKNEIRQICYADRVIQAIVDPIDNEIITIILPRYINTTTDYRAL